MKIKSAFAFVATCMVAVQLQATAQQPTTPERNKDLDEVTVYGMRTIVPLKKIPSKVEVIQSSALERTSQTNLGDLLKYHSSIDIVQYPGFLSTVGMRGFRPNGKYVTILTNGIPTGTDNVSSLGLSDISQVEVLKGPFSAIYGTGAMGGVINMITRKSKGDLTGSAHLGYGSYNTARGAVALGGRIIDNLSFDASFTYNYQGKNYNAGNNYLLSKTDVEKAILDPTVKGKEKVGSLYNSLMGRVRLGYDFTPDWSLNVYTSIFSANNLPMGGNHWLTTEPKGKNLNRYSTSMEVLGKVAGHALQFTPYYNIEKADYLDKYKSKDAITTSKSSARTLGFLLQDNFSIAQQQVTVGLDGQRMDRESLSFDNKTGEAKAPYQPAYGTRSLAAFAQSNLTFFEDRLNVSLGARLDYMNFLLSANTFLKNEAKTETYTQITPNLGLKYEVIPGLLLHASAGGGFLAPDAYQKSGEYDGTYGKTRGNPDLKPERSFTFDAGVGYSSRDLGLVCDLSYFRTDLQDMIYSVSGADKVKTFANGDKGRMSGLELLLSYDWGSLADYAFSLRSYLNSTWMLESEMYTKGADKWSPMLLVRKTNLTFGLDFIYRDLELGIKGRYAGPSLDNNWNKSSKTIRPDLPALFESAYPDYAKAGLILNPSFMTFDASAHYSFLGSFRVSAYLNNLLDEHYFEKDGYNMIGRNFLVGLSYRF